MKKSPVIRTQQMGELLELPVFNRGGSLVAEGLFAWKGSPVWPVPISLHKAFSIADVTWKIVSKDVAISEASTYQAVSQSGDRIEVVCPEYRKPWAMVSFGKEPWMIDRPCNEAILKDPNGVEFARATPAWKDSDEQA